jgi:uncharacterized protein YegP (UPF0339 family)
MQRKKIGYYISKGKCLKVFAVKKVNKRTNRVQLKKVNSKGKLIRKGTKVYKTKANCEKALRRMKKAKSKRRSPVRKTKKAKKAKKSKARKAKRSPKRRSRFGQGCAYSVPYFGDMVPSIAKFVSGTPDTGLTSSAWHWPTPPGALGLDRQQGGWQRARNIVNN